jgi:hypothetical protein
MKPHPLEDEKQREGQTHNAWFSQKTETSVKKDAFSADC